MPWNILAILITKIPYGVAHQLKTRPYDGASGKEKEELLYYSTPNEKTQFNKKANLHVSAIWGGGALTIGAACAKLQSVSLIRDCHAST